MSTPRILEPGSAASVAEYLANADDATKRDDLRKRMRATHRSARAAYSITTDEIGRQALAFIPRPGPVTGLMGYPR